MASTLLLDTEDENSSDEECSYRIKELKLFSEHSDLVLTAEHFQQTGKIVSGGYGRSVIITPVETGTTQSFDRIHENNVNCIIKLTELKFVTCSSDKTIKGFEFDQNTGLFVLTKVFRVFQKGEIIWLMGIDDDTFISFCRSGEVKIISYSKGEVIRELQKQSIGWVSKSIPSISFKDSFFLSSSFGDANRIKLFNYQKNKLIRNFGNHSHTIYNLSSFLNSKGDEILLVVGCSPNFFFYNTSIKDRKNCLVKKYESPFATIYSILVFNLQRGSTFLVAGGRSEMNCFLVIEKEEEFEVKLLRCETRNNKKVHSSVIKGIKCVRREEESVVVLTYSYDGKMKYLQFQSKWLKGIDKQASLDLLERMEYLFKEEFQSNHFQISSLVDLKMKNLTIRNIYKTLMSNN